MKKNIQVSKRLTNMVRNREELMTRSLNNSNPAGNFVSARRSVVNDRGRMFSVVEVYS